MRTFKLMDMKRKISKGNGKRIPLAIMFTMMSSAVLFAQQHQWIDVTDTYLENADFSTGTSEGWQDGNLDPVVNKDFKNAEYFRKKNIAGQKVFGLRPGNYKLTVRGFHRAAGANGGKDYEAGTEVINAFLIAGDAEIPFVSLYSGVKDETIPNQRDGWPDGMEGMAKYCEAHPDQYNNVLEFTVSDKGEMLIGVDMRGGEWTCWDDFKLYFDGVAFDAFRMQMNRATVMRDSLNTLDIPASSELTTLLDKYSGYTESTPEEDINAAVGEIAGKVELAMAVCLNANTMQKDITAAQGIYDKIESGAYTVSEQVKANLSKAISEAKAVLAKPTLAEVADALVEGVPAIEEAIKNTNAVVGLNHSLQVAKGLADKIGGLSDTEEYKKVAADLNATELTYTDMVTDVEKLNAVCKAAMTEQFLGTASAEHPIDMTSFITNPNIFQDGVMTEMPGGWVMIDRGSSDNGSPTLADHADTELHCSSWSDNDANSICKGHYQQMIGKEDGVKLPNGVYELSAATYTTGQEGTKIYLYATPDSVNYSRAIFNRDAEAYGDASKNMGTTTTVQNILVSDGKLYIGINGEGRSGVMGAEWRADNFRLSYVGSDATEAYRDRLTARLEEGIVWHDSLVNYGIDDWDYLGWVLDEEEGYYQYLADGVPIQDMITAIEDMDNLILDAQKVIDQYLALTPLVRKGNDLFDALNNEKVFAQPAARKTFTDALVEASIIAEDMTWETYVSDEVGRQTEALNEATTTLKSSIAICYPMGTAIVLANQIGGLSENEAYKNVKELLKQDEFDNVDADMAVKELQAVCLTAMTPDVLAKATSDNPFDMTTFVVNPNIYQDYVDEAGNPSRKVINGWICETNADGTDRTEHTEDTWLWCYSWSGHEGHNIGSATNYRQVVGTQIGEEGKFELPVGTYRVEAATHATGGADALWFYAQTNDVEISTVPDILGQDSTVYTYTEDQFEYSILNGNRDLWDIAQAEVGTNTIIPAVYVDKGAVTIGIKGDGRVVGGHGQQWFADNFRFYYINSGKGDSMDKVLKDSESLETELVDVYDLTGTLVRRQVKRADAVKGLKKGIYIAGGKKYVVTGK